MNGAPALEGTSQVFGHYRGTHEALRGQRSRFSRSLPWESLYESDGMFLKVHMVGSALAVSEALVHHGCLCASSRLVKIG